MHYMARNREKRADPRELVEGARSIISVILPYYPEGKQEKGPKISKYAVGKDYHIVVKDKLYQLYHFIKERDKNARGRVFTDSAPVFDKAWAEKSGLGWTGKNTLLLNKKHGSYFFIGELIINLELLPDKVETNNYCGTCTRCLDACPTGALTAPYQLDARKCISYLTIEHEGELPDEIDTRGYIFGCDICQDVCPWNAKIQPGREKEFSPSGQLLAMDWEDWEKLTPESFAEMFNQSPLKRRTWEGVQKNIRQAHKKD